MEDSCTEVLDSAESLNPMNWPLPILVSEMEVLRVLV